MKAIVILYQGSEVNTEVLTEMVKLIRNTTTLESSNVMVHQFQDKELGLHIASLAKPVIAATSVEGVIAAEQFVNWLVNNFGDPRDNENAVRARLNKAWYTQFAEITSERVKFGEIIKYFSTLYHNSKSERKIPVEIVKILNMLNNRGFKFLPEYAAMLVRFGDM